MIKTDEQFDAFVRKLEGYAKRNPGAYKFWVGALAMLGFAYIFLVLAVLVAMVVGLVYLLMTMRHGNYGIAKIGIFLLIFIGIILRSLWVEFETPEGLPLPEGQAPRLFAMLKGICETLRAPAFHDVLLTDDFNASVLQVPRLGIFGWQRNYLMIGLPLLLALTPDQFRAVIAHEIGHLSGNHSRFGGWIYRVRCSWIQLLQQLEASEHGGTWIFVGFFQWYAPYFSAYSFVLRRQNEYEADRCAVQIVGKQTMAEMLMSLPIKMHYMDDTFWPRFYRQAIDHPEPPSGPFASLVPALRAGVSTAETRRWFLQAMSDETDTADTHPCLKDRLAAIGYTPPPVGKSGDTVPKEIAATVALTESAAERYLGPLTERVVSGIDAAWKGAVIGQWREQHTKAQQALGSLGILLDRADREPLSEDEEWCIAKWSAQYEPNDVAIPRLRTYVAAHPANAEAHFLLGVSLLEEQDDTGIAHLDRVMTLDRNLIGNACGNGYAYLMGQGRTDEAKRFLEKGKSIHQSLMQQPG